MLVVIVLIMYISLYRFSRKIVWLEVLTTNNDPNVVLVSYLLAVLQNNDIARCALLVNPRGAKGYSSCLVQIMSVTTLTATHLIYRSISRCH